MKEWMDGFKSVSDVGGVHWQWSLSNLKWEKGYFFECSKMRLLLWTGLVQLDAWCRMLPQFYTCVAEHFRSEIIHPIGLRIDHLADPDLNNLDRAAYDTVHFPQRKNGG